MSIIPNFNYINTALLTKDTKPYQTLPNLTKPYQPNQKIQNLTKPYLTILNS